MVHEIWSWMVLAAVTALFPAARARTETAEDFYRGKQVKVIVSFDTGTDYDQWSG